MPSSTLKVDKSEGRMLIIKKIMELQDIKERYSKYPADEPIGDDGYTYGKHIQYLDEKMHALVWAMDVLKLAEEADGIEDSVDRSFHLAKACGLAFKAKIEVVEGDL